MKEMDVLCIMDLTVSHIPVFLYDTRIPYDIRKKENKVLHTASAKYLYATNE
jgi:hypothetical protein